MHAGGQGGFIDSVRSGGRAPAHGSVRPGAWGSMVDIEAEQPPFSVLDGDTPDYGNNIREGGRSRKDKVHKEGFSLDEDDFINTLDAKLKDLEEEEKKKKKAKKRSSSLDNRPMFITTVKTGIFLDPPPELAAILGYNRSYNVSSGSTGSQKSGEELMYSFSSQPRVLNNNRPKPKINNEKQQQVNLEKQKAKNNTVRAKRDLGSTNHNNNLNSNNTTSNNNNTPNTKKEESMTYGNIMYDRRVVRGPTYLHHPIPTQTAESQAARQAEARRRSMARRKAQSQRARTLRYRLGTPPPVEGRKHQNMQTQEYLEELFDNPPEMNVYTQTDFFLDRPPTPAIEQVSTGVDVATQVFPGELFHFDTEVRPVLEVLVGKTIEQSLMEVFEEDETAAIREQQRALREARDAELEEQQRLQEQENRRKRQLDERIFEQEEAAMDQKETESRVAAAVLTTGYIADLLPSVMQGLKDAGYLYEEVNDDMEGEFMDWLIKEVKTEMQRMVENRDLLSEMLRDILATRAELYKALGDKSAAKRGADDEEELTPSESLGTVQHEEESVGEEANEHASLHEEQAE